MNGLRETFLMGGDFNARIQYRDPNESDLMGPHILGRG